jgi:hypothetical protein
VANAQYAVLFGLSYNNIFVDYYARTDDATAYNRDNNLTVRFFNGDWTTVVHSESGFNIDNTLASSNRLTIPVAIESDRFLITTTATDWSIAELRANGISAVPEPAVAHVLTMIGLLLSLRRNRPAAIG